MRVWVSGIHWSVTLVHAPSALDVHVRERDPRLGSLTMGVMWPPERAQRLHTCLHTCFVLPW